MSDTQTAAKILNDRNLELLHENEIALEDGNWCLLLTSKNGQTGLLIDGKRLTSIIPRLILIKQESVNLLTFMLNAGVNSETLLGNLVQGDYVSGDDSKQITEETFQALDKEPKIIES